MWAFKYHLMIPGTHLLGHCSTLVISFNEDAYNEDANFFMPPDCGGALMETCFVLQMNIILQKKKKSGGGG